ncbi:imidazole glycerol phosphate synthase subunit HisH [Devosia aquimaris]|uniref:imidazole glycerol phosphate synthase subunit HisH n=1 Tax=Devosia aquimaris TaxID=2866214 RepID=UPI001CD17C26|nr:imidazole glycerol phosphate synthase subunit HisH [Devosia sp. CJK-A8-3]
MKRRTIGIVDYGVGNIGSLERSLSALGYRCQTTSNPETLAASSLILLPGVGAFPTAMAALHDHDMVGFLQERAQSGQPLVGICLGMQLLADSSDEIRETSGLGIIPGYVTALENADWHIGWNTLEAASSDPLVRPSDGRTVYFNHSFVLRTSPEYVIGVARIDQGMTPFPVAIRRENTVGLQFHPEKSQAAGLQLLTDVIEGLCRAA